MHANRPKIITGVARDRVERLPEGLLAGMATRRCDKCGVEVLIHRAAITACRGRDHVARCRECTLERLPAAKSAEQHRAEALKRLQSTESHSW